MELGQVGFLEAVLGVVVDMVVKAETGVTIILASRVAILMEMQTYHVNLAVEVEMKSQQIQLLVEESLVRHAGHLVFDIYKFQIVST